MGRIGLDGPLAPGARNWNQKVPIKLIIQRTLALV